MNEMQKAKGAMTIMIARPPKVGFGLRRKPAVWRAALLIGAMLGLAASASAVEPARIGQVKILHDGKVDKICLEYQGDLHYREYQFPRAKYGYLDFEPAVAEDSKLRLKPQGDVLSQISVRGSPGDRQRVRLLYQLDHWVAPTIRDTGDRVEIHFVPQAASSARLDEPVIPPLEPAAADGPAVPAVMASTTQSPAGFGGNPNDDIFADYMKLETQKPSTQARAAVAESPVAAPKPPASPIASTLLAQSAGPEASAQAGKSALASAQGGEGTPAAAEPVQIGSGGASKVFVPETGVAEQDKITGGRGYEFIDLTEEVFQKQVSLTFKEADLQNAIRILARHAELNLVMDPSDVKGRLTVELNNVPVGGALAGILRAHKLDLVRETGGIYRVVPSRLVRRERIVEEITVHIPLNWVPAEEVKKILDPVIDGEIGADTLGNSLIITDTPLKIEEIANVIRRMDKPEKQVMLEARLVEMNSNLSRGLGVSWNLARLDRDVANEALGPAAQNVLGQIPGIPAVVGYHPVTGAPITWTPPGTQLTQDVPYATNPYSFDALQRDIMSISEPLANQSHGLQWAVGRSVNIFGQEFQLSAFLQAAEDANLAKVLANPRVVTVNNQPANIDILRRIPYVSTIVGAGGVQSITYNYEDVGVQMTITPNITNNDYVRMSIQPSQKIFISQRGEARPTIDERVSQTNVIVKDEETAVIAGLRQQEFSEAMTGVPWLNKIPILGWAFKGKNYRQIKTDLLAFVTPHIIKEGQIISDQEQARYNEIDIQWDLPDYFFDDVKIDLGQ
ncbi:hypothetical protein AMJ85_00650 [candidate division BRC1 bacterium SM23_51]|nr:MAG: hypothetical protein AMJ85_00650 [candidate division BRC1 bacterium SM23_51]